MPYTQPVKVGEEYTVEILNIGEKGDGLAKIANFAIFIPCVEIEHVYRIKITKVFEKYAFAKRIKEV